MTPVSAIVAPTDKSMPPLTMIIVIPIAPIAVITVWERTMRRLNAERYRPGSWVSRLKTRTIAISPSAGPMRTIQRRTRAGATSDRSTPSSVGAPAG